MGNNAPETDNDSGNSSEPDTASDAIAPPGSERTVGADSFDDLLSALNAFDAAEMLKIREREYQDRLRALLKELLDVVDALDDLEGHYAQLKNVSAVKTPKKSIALIRRMLLRVLKGQEVVPICANGHRVNLERHEVVGVQHVTDAAYDTVVQEILTGYLWQGRVLRPAKVLVGKSEAEPQ